MAVKGPAQDTVRRGWRLFKTNDFGSLRPPFGYGSEDVGRSWSRAQCRVRALTPLGRGFVDLHKVQAHDRRPHTAPGEKCGCGWRVYPDRDAVAKGVRRMPEVLQAQIRSRPEVVLARVEYGGTVAAQARLDLPQFDNPLVREGLSHMLGIPADDVLLANQDECFTVRAQWLRTIGPVYLGAKTLRSTGQALRRAGYEVRRCEGMLHAAMLANDYPAPARTGRPAWH